MKCSWILLPRESLLKPSNIFPDHFLRIYPYISKNVIILCILGGIFFKNFCFFNGGFPGSSDGKESTCNAGDQCSIPGSGRSPGEGNAFFFLNNRISSLIKIIKSSELNQQNLSSFFFFQ